MVIDAPALAREMRRRRVGRPELVGALDELEATGVQTWIPGELRDVSATFLVLAALALSGPARSTRPE